MQALHAITWHNMRSTNRLSRDQNRVFKYSIKIKEMFPKNMTINDRRKLQQWYCYMYCIIITAIIFIFLFMLFHQRSLSNWGRSCVSISWGFWWLQNITKLFQLKLEWCSFFEGFQSISRCVNKDGDKSSVKKVEILWGEGEINSGL